MGITNFFIHECVILARTSSKDSVGGDAGAWTEKANSNYFGYIGQPKKDERMSGGVETVFASHVHKYPTDVVLNAENRIKCVNETVNGNANPFYNKTFEVLPIKNVWSHHQKANLKMVN